MGLFAEAIEGHEHANSIRFLRNYAPGFVEHSIYDLLPNADVEEIDDAIFGLKHMCRALVIICLDTKDPRVWQGVVESSFTAGEISETTFDIFTKFLTVDLPQDFQATFHEAVQIYKLHTYHA